jgi:hypothetical protein
MLLKKKEYLKTEKKEHLIIEKNINTPNKRSYLYLSIFVNLILTIIIPIFTYILFMDNNSVQSLILNCLSGIFLINLDNEMATYSCGKDFLKLFCHDQLLISFIKDGLKENMFEKQSSSIINLFGFVYILQFCVVFGFAAGLVKCL